VLGAFFEAILQGFRGAPAENLPTLRDDALAMLRSNNQLLEAARNEPSGGPGCARDWACSRSLDAPSSTR